MKLLQKYPSQIATAVVVAILCIGGFAAYQSWFAPAEPFVANPRVLELERELANRDSIITRMEKEHAAASAAHDARYQALLEDTLKTSKIKTQYDGIRSEHRSLEVDSAVGLAHYRLRVEPQYGARFDYGYLLD